MTEIVGGELQAGHAGHHRPEDRGEMSLALPRVALAPAGPGAACGGRRVRRDRASGDDAGDDGAPLIRLRGVTKNYGTGAGRAAWR